MDAAPLIGTEAAPVPDGGQGFWFEGAGGARLRAALFPAKAATRGSVILSAGRTEPIEKYFEVIGELQGRGFAVLAHDWRGQGLSHRMLTDRHRGHAEGHADYLEDLRMLLALTGDRLPRPWIGFGHSMGGCLTALAAVKGVVRFDVLFLSAPMLGLVATRKLGGMAGLIAGTMIGLGRSGEYILKEAFEPFLGSFEANVLTHDAGRYERYRDQLRACPDLALGGVTWGWMGFALEAGAILGRRTVNVPVSIVGAGDDHLVLTGPSRAFAGRAPKGRYAEIAGAFHEVLMETDARRALVWAEFDALTGRMG